MKKLSLVGTLSLVATVAVGAAVLSGSLIGCNRIAKKFGGTINEELTPGEKMINVSWKGDDLWVLTRPMLPGDIVETYRYHEISNMGIIEGTVILKERK